MTSEERKREWMRVILFCLLAFGLAWVIEIPLHILKGGFDEWGDDPHLGIFAIIAMATPAIANVLTRLITKEGMKENYLRLRFKGHVNYYLLGAFLPVINSMVSGVLESLYLTGGLNPFDRGEAPFLEVILNILMIVALSVSIFVFAFGEEFGWRGYLYPKLERLLGTPGALLLGGIIWGVWHAPLTVGGHNFGRDYWGFPWLGIVVMSAFCTVIGVLLFWITKRSGSVYPASIMHAVNNELGATGALLLFPQMAEIDVEETGAFTMMLLHTGGIMIVTAAVLCIMLHQNKKAGISPEIPDNSQAA